MKNDIHDLVDEILKFCLTNNNVFHYKGQNENELFGKKEPLLYQALNHMTTVEPKILTLRGTSRYYDLTGHGVDFAKDGGYVGQKRREQIEQLTNEQDRQLTRLVNQSLLATNASVLETNKSIVETNISVQTTNQSVIDTNASVKQVGEKTVDIYSFQKWTTSLTIFVAIMALAIAWFSYKSQSDNENLLQLIQRQLDKQEQMQLQIDSLKDVLNEQSFRDTLPTKHP